LRQEDGVRNVIVDLGTGLRNASRIEGRNFTLKNCAVVVRFGFGWQAECVSGAGRNEQLSFFGPYDEAPRSELPDAVGAALAVSLIVTPWLLIGWLIWILM
jgi:hypothetical protein